VRAYLVGSLDADFVGGPVWLNGLWFAEDSQLHNCRWGVWNLFIELSGDWQWEKLTVVRLGEVRLWVGGHAHAGVHWAPVKRKDGGQDECQ